MLPRGRSQSANRQRLEGEREEFFQGLRGKTKIGSPHCGHAITWGELCLEPAMIFPQLDTIWNESGAGGELLMKFLILPIKNARNPQGWRAFPVAYFSDILKRVRK
jgi:hypothetical protein